MIQIKLTKKQIEELKKFHRLNNTRVGEHALIILKSAQGLSVPQIAKTLFIQCKYSYIKCKKNLERHKNTVFFYLPAY